jgi:hypothetical protein
MVMTMKKTTSFNISVGESEAKLDANSCHPFVGGEATSTLMTRCLILAIYSRNLRINLFQKSSTRIYLHHTRPHRISTYTKAREGGREGEREAAAVPLRDHALRHSLGQHSGIMHSLKQHSGIMHSLGQHYATTHSLGQHYATSDS